MVEEKIKSTLRGLETKGAQETCEVGKVLSIGLGAGLLGGFSLKTQQTVRHFSVHMLYFNKIQTRLSGRL